MKKNLNIIIFSVISIFLLSGILMTQTLRNIPDKRIDYGTLEKLILIKGSAGTTLNYLVNSRSFRVTINTLKLTRQIPYKITGVKINQHEIPKLPNGTYRLWLSNFPVSVGKELVIKVKLARNIVDTLKPARVEVPVAKVRVHNLFKEYIFPTHNSTLPITNIGSSFLFKWSFMGRTVKTFLLVDEAAPPRTNVVTLAPTGTSAAVNKSSLSPTTEYSLSQISQDGKRFNLMKTAHSNSEIHFSFSVALKFKTQ